MPNNTPKGFTFQHRLDGGGRQVQGAFTLRSWYGPVRRWKIRRAKRNGDLREVFELIVLNAKDFDLDAWDGTYYRHIAPVLLDHRGL